MSQQEREEVDPILPIPPQVTETVHSDSAAEDEPPGILSIVSRTFSRPENFVWNSNTPHAGAVTEESNPAGVWMNQGAGKRGNTIDFHLQFKCDNAAYGAQLDDEIRRGGRGLLITSTLLRVNKLTLKPVLTEDAVSAQSKTNQHGDLVGNNGKLIVRCNRGSQVKMVKRDDVYQAVLSLRIETTSSKSDRSEFMIRFETNNPAIPPCYSKPVFVVTKIRTPNHYRHDKTLAKLRDVLRRLESVQKMNPAKVKEIMDVAQNIVNTADAFENCTGERSVKKHQPNPRMPHVVSSTDAEQLKPLTAKAKAAAASAAAAAATGGNALYGGTIVSDTNGPPIVDSVGHLALVTKPKFGDEIDSSQETAFPPLDASQLSNVDESEERADKYQVHEDEHVKLGNEVEESNDSQVSSKKRKAGERIEDTAASVLQSLGSSVLRKKMKEQSPANDEVGA